MKKILTSLLALIMILSCMAVMTVFAADTGALVQYVVENETTVSVTVKLRGELNTFKTVATYTTYDNTKLAFVSGEKGEVLNNITSTGVKDVPARSFQSVNYSAGVEVSGSASDPEKWLTVEEGLEKTVATFTFNKIAGQAIDDNTISFGTVRTSTSTKKSTLIIGSGTYTSDVTPSLFITEFTPYAVEENTITAAISGKGRVFIDGASIADEDVITLAEGVSTASIKIVPNNGYEVSVATLTGETGNIVGAAGGLHTATISGAADLAVTFTAKADLAENKPIPASATFAETKDVDGKPVEARTAFATAPTAGIEEAGLYIEKDGVAFITNTRDAVGPYFKSDNTNANGQYGIELIALGEGTYTATPYVKIGGEYVLASSSATFTVE